MRRNGTARRNRVAGTVVLAATILLTLTGCSAGEADDAEAIVQDASDDSTSASDPTTDDSVSDAGTTAADELPISVFELEVGTCFDDPAFAAEDASTIGETIAVQCFDPHDAEVYDTVAYTQSADDAFPGEDAVQGYADDRCFDRFEAFVGIPYAESRLDIATIWPTEQSWGQGDRQAVCVVFDLAHQKLEGTMDGAEE